MLWGVYQQHSAARQRLETVLLRQRWQIAGLSPAVALSIVWRELDMQPFGHAWLIRAACFWNTLAGVQGFHRLLDTDAVSLALQQHTHAWVHSLRRALSLVGNLVALDSIGIGDLRYCLAVQLAQP